MRWILRTLVPQILCQYAKAKYNKHSSQNVNQKLTNGRTDCIKDNQQPMIVLLNQMGSVIEKLEALLGKVDNKDGIYTDIDGIKYELKLYS